MFIEEIFQEFYMTDSRPTISVKAKEFFVFNFLELLRFVFMYPSQLCQVRSVDHGDGEFFEGTWIRKDVFFISGQINHVDYWCTHQYQCPRNFELQREKLQRLECLRGTSFAVRLQDILP